MRLAIALFWLLSHLPLRLLAPVGKGLGMLVYWIAWDRRRVVRINLRLCFPDMAEREREKLSRRHFRAFGRSVLERSILWWGSEQRVRRLVRFEGREFLDAVHGRPLIVLAPHFVGLDMGGIRISIDYDMMSMYSKQKNPALDRILLHGRTRFGDSILVSRQDGLRSVIRGLRKGVGFFYLPDMDFGARDSVFVPFFGVPAATVTGLSRLARATGARVVPCITRQLPGAQGYVTRFHPAWENFPGESVEEDTRRMNAFIEERVREMPEQYYWLHKRFKTRPPGEPKFYR
ncbi:MAG TPA: lipid A biosynthesis lauroyl acyltransferase [Burkholderiales bacterium]|nr:lipid A biosynthesis lauroyl acyltransferase [Burkholderiales bacterium]